jgi:hypothetical protein
MLKGFFETRILKIPRHFVFCFQKFFVRMRIAAKKLPLGSSGVLESKNNMLLA